MDFAEFETTETENENGNTERKKIALATVQYTASRTSTVLYFVHSWLGCYMLGRGETEFSSSTAHLAVQSISSPFDHCVFCSVHCFEIGSRSLSSPEEDLKK